jgi:hypothetical protein
MAMAMQTKGNWNLMWMGQAFLVATQQSGPRGGDKIYSANWGILAAVRNLGRGSLMLRGMVSLDPMTITGKQYPLLFQSGETANGKPIVDEQHPHDLLMEVSIHYARPIGGKAMLNFYYAPVGDAALGPIAFPHRASAMELSRGNPAATGWRRYPPAAFAGRKRPMRMTWFAASPPFITRSRSAAHLAGRAV